MTLRWVVSGRTALPSSTGTDSEETLPHREDLLCRRQQDFERSEGTPRWVVGQTTSVDEREDLEWSREALEVLRTARLEAETTILDEAPGAGRDHDLRCSADGHHPRGRMDRHAADVSRKELHLAGVDTDPDGQAHPIGGVADRCSTPDRSLCAGEHRQEAVAGRVHLHPEVALEAGRPEVAICSYAVKYASAYYGPFRDAADSVPAFGDRRSYQMDYRNSREARREAALDIDEGADMVMVKPAGPYLDVIHDLRPRVDVPLVAYQVSGEMAMIEAAATRGWIDRERVITESLTGIFRAGADIVLTYFAVEVAELLQEV